MHPDAVRLLDLVERMLREKAETLPYALDEAAFPDGADEKHRDDQQHDQKPRYVVEYLHCCVPFSVLFELDVV